MDQPDPPKKKILIIDDDPSIALVTCSRLESAGFEVITALDGEEGLTKARDHTPHLVLVDLRMPKVDGRAFVERFRKEKGSENISVIVVSAQASTLRDRPIDGVDDVICKPFTPETLIQTIRRHLSKHNGGTIFL